MLPPTEYVCEPSIACSSYQDRLYTSACSVNEASSSRQCCCGGCFVCRGFTHGHSLVRTQYQRTHGRMLFLVFVTCALLVQDVLCVGAREFGKRLACDFTVGTRWTTTLLLSLFLGGFAADRFYLGLTVSSLSEGRNPLASPPSVRALFAASLLPCSRDLHSRSRPRDSPALLDACSVLLALVPRARGLSSFLLSAAWACGL